MSQRQHKQISPSYRQHGFLPAQDPLSHFPTHSPFAKLDAIGHELPSLLMEDNFRQFIQELVIPPWPQQTVTAADLPTLRLYYLRLGFIASAYINQVGKPTINVLPQNIAIPLCHACKLLKRPPILSYDAYALYNWKRFRSDGPIALGNIDTLQNFVHLYDEHWFILIHIEIEAIAAQIIDAIAKAQQAVIDSNESQLNQALETIAQAINQQTRVLQRIPEHMDPALYFKTFRPYIRFFEHVVYEGVDQKPIDFRGETGAQSSIMPSLVAFMKIPHQSSILTEHLADMRHYMPIEHRQLIEQIEAFAEVRPFASAKAFNNVLEAMAEFREVHFGWAHEYINKRTSDPRGTGGTPYMHWLEQLIEETLAYRL